MILGKREYSEAEMMRMQRDAEERVREMHNRSRQAAGQDNSSPPPPRNRNWNMNSGTRKQNYNRKAHNEHVHREESPPVHEPKPAPPPPEEEKKPTTIIEDIMGALGMDEDYLLIIGLLLILVNQRADTTLILALVYLLI